MDRQRKLESVAKGYQDGGYQVTLRPRAEHLPQFLAPFEVDLIARKGDDNVVVEVRARQDLIGNPLFLRLAGAVNSQPGWRLDLVVPNFYPWPEPVCDEAAEPSREQTATLLQRAEAFAAAGELDVACVLACAALEATLRTAAAAVAPPLEDKSPASVLAVLFSKGPLSRDEFEQLSQALRVRNALIHGLTAPALNSSIPAYVISFVRTLAAGEPILNRSANGPGRAS